MSGPGLCPELVITQSLARQPVAQSSRWESLDITSSLQVFKWTWGAQCCICLSVPCALSPSSVCRYPLNYFCAKLRQWQPIPVLLPGKSHGQRSLVGCSSWGHEESDMIERLPFHFSLSCIGEGNGNPLHCSCLEDPRDGAAWWSAVYGIAQSRTRLKLLSSSSSSSMQHFRINYLVLSRA